MLSGTGSDGTLGVRAIKGEGGMVMAQNPDSTEFDGKPTDAVVRVWSPGCSTGEEAYSLAILLQERPHV